MKKHEFEFGHWLMGFIDAEGCFRIKQHINKNFHCHFGLKLRDDDKEIIHLIHKKTKLGKIRYLKADKGKNPGVKWEIEKKSDCILFVNLIDSFGLRSKKQQDYKIWKMAVKYWNNNFDNTNKRRIKNRHAIMLKMKNDLQVVKKYDKFRKDIKLKADIGFNFWLSGFSDGEGCFSISKNNWGNYVCEFGIGQRNDDGNLLPKISRILGYGSIHNRYSPGLVQRQRLFRIRKKMDCMKIIDVLKNNLRTKKKRDFKIWIQAVRLLNFSIQLKNPNIYKFSILKNKIEQTRKYSQ